VALWPNACLIAYELARPPSSSPWDNGPWQIRIYTRLFTSDWKRSNIARATFYISDIFTFIFSGESPRYFCNCNSAQRLRKQCSRCFNVRRRDVMKWLGLAYLRTVVNVSRVSDSLGNRNYISLLDEYRIEYSYFYLVADYFWSTKLFFRFLISFIHNYNIFFENYFFCDVIINHPYYMLLH